MKYGRMHALLRKLAAIAACSVLLSVPANTAHADAPVKIGNVQVDLGGSGTQTLVEADNTFLTALTTQSYYFSGDKPTLEISQGNISGTAGAPIRRSYNTNIVADYEMLDVVWKTQRTIQLDGYTFVNRVPEKISVPVPVYLEEGEGNPGGWSYFSNQNSGYTNTVIAVLPRDLLKAANGFSGKWTSSALRYQINIQHLGNKGTDTAESNNQICWYISAKFKSLYTVDIAPLNNGGTPTLSGLKGDVGTLSESIRDVNGKFFRSGELNNDVDVQSVKLGKIDDLAAKDLDGVRYYGDYGTKYAFESGAKEGYVVDYVRVNIYDPVSGVLMSEEKYSGASAVERALAASNTIKGKTEIRVNYAPEGPGIEKTCATNGAYVKKGDSIVYVLTVKNVVNKACTVTVRDALPAQVSAESYTVDGAAQQNVWAGEWRGEIPANGQVVIKINATVNCGFDTGNLALNTIKNKAILVFVNNAGEEQTTETEEIVHYLTPSPNYTITKTRITVPATGDGFVAGQDTVIDYSVMLQNTGDVPLTINLFDAYEKADYFTIVSANPVANVRLPADDPATAANEGLVEAMFQARVTAAAQPGNHKNTVAATTNYNYADSKTGEPITIAGLKAGDPLFRQAEALTPIVPPFPALSLTKTVNGWESYVGVPGETLNFALLVRNTGTVKLESVLIKDVATEGLINSTLKSLTSLVTGLGRTVSFSNGTIAALEAGDWVLIQYTAQISPDANGNGTHTNTATASATYNGTLLTSMDTTIITTTYVSEITPPSVPRMGDDTNLDQYIIGVFSSILVGAISLLALLIYLLRTAKRKGRHHER